MNSLKEKSNSKTIPKIIWQFWHDKKLLPDHYRQAIIITKTKNKDYLHKYVDDEFILSTLSNLDRPLLKQLYQCNKIPASRSDIARLVLLYKFGGIYLDASIAFHGSINKVFADQEKTYLLQRDDLEQYKHSPLSAHVVNGIIAAPPKSLFIMDCIEAITETLNSGILNNNVLKATCLILNDVLKKNKNKYLIKKLSFKDLKANHLDHIRLRGKFNTWKPLQEFGTIDFKQLKILQKND